MVPTVASHPVASIKSRIEAAKKAYVSIPSGLTTSELDTAAHLARIQRAFPHLTDACCFATSFTDTKHWWNALRQHLQTVDCLVVVCDSTRTVGRGIRREIDAARRLHLPIVVFKWDEEQPRPYYGYDVIDKSASVIRLRKRSDTKRGKAELAAETAGPTERRSLSHRGARW